MEAVRDIKNPEFEELIPCSLCDDRKALPVDRPDFEKAFDPVVYKEDGVWRVYCPCGLRIGDFATRESAIGHWNRRGKFLLNDGEPRFVEVKVEKDPDDFFRYNASEVI